ncbi:MAG: hypothetical protein D6805_07920 [Planctomycetota bacterium]|nr:MAG: hypothetical protein D6805_07920 [Planctomycetota bacterium]
MPSLRGITRDTLKCNPSDKSAFLQKRAANILPKYSVYNRQNLRNFLGISFFTSPCIFYFLSLKLIIVKNLVPKLQSRRKKAPHESRFDQPK